MKQYQEYKDSGVEWIGDIPSHWRYSRIKFNAFRSSSGVWGDDPKDNENDITCIRIADFDYSHRNVNLSNSIKRNIDTSQLKNRLLHRGDLLIEKSGGGDATPVGRVVMFNSDVKATYTNFIHSLTMNGFVDNRFFLYYFIMLYSNKINLLFFNQTTGLQNLKVSDYIGQIIYLPPLAEQKAIADYLDEKCGKIDVMTERIDKKIAIYERLRRAIISKAVTKGLNPNTPLRPSGVEWIGEIPKHWEVKRFGYLAWIRARLGWKGLKADEYVESGYPFLSAFNIVNDKMNWESLNYINQFRYEESPEIMLHPGDILLVKDGAGIGKCARVDSLPKGESTTNGSLAVITPFETVNYKYIYYFIISDSFNQYKDILINGMGVPHLTQGEMKKMYLPVPPIKDQEEIAEYLDKRCQVIEDSIVKYIKQKELLERYRKALIAQVVTGKRRVCEPSFIYPDTTPISPAMAAEENL